MAFFKNSVSLKNRASSRLLAKNRVSQVFWDPIKNHVSPRSVLLKAVYLEALLYRNHLKKVTKMAVILMDLVHTEILIRFILFSNVKFEFVLIFADNLRAFFLIFDRSG